jgi:hypothetical protein
MELKISDRTGCRAIVAGTATREMHTENALTRGYATTKIRTFLGERRNKFGTTRVGSTDKANVFLAL